MASVLRKVVFFVLLVGVAYLAYQFMIKPANRHLSEQRARVQTKLAKLAEFEKASVAAKDLSKQLEQLQEAIAFFESRLPPKNEIQKVLEQVTLVEQKQGLKSKKVLTLKEKENSGYIEHPIKMELVGNFKSFYSFLLEIEKLPRIMKIRELEIKKQTDLEVTADFVISVFFLST